MIYKRVIFFFAVTMAACFGFFGLPVNNSIDLRMPSDTPQDASISTVRIQMPDWLVFQEAIASPYRRSVRRTARRTSRRTSARHSGSRYYGGAAVATGVAVGVTAIAVGSMVASLPPKCSTVVVNGVTYQNCSGTYYVPSGSQWVVVSAP